MDNAKTGTFIKELRKEKHLTQKSLRICSTSPTGLSQSGERGLCASGYILIGAPCRHFGCYNCRGFSLEAAWEQQGTHRQSRICLPKFIDYSEGEIAQKTKAFTRKVIAYILSAFLLFFLLIPTERADCGRGFCMALHLTPVCARKSQLRQSRH